MENKGEYTFERKVEDWYVIDFFHINDDMKMISCPYTWMEKYGVEHFPIPVFNLWKKGYVLQLNIL